jgi:hypothetical protein
MSLSYPGDALTVSFHLRGLVIPITGFVIPSGARDLVLGRRTRDGKVLASDPSLRSG